MLEKVREKVSTAACDQMVAMHSKAAESACWSNGHRHQSLRCLRRLLWGTAAGRRWWRRLLQAVAAGSSGLPFGMHDTAQWNHKMD